MTSSGGVERAIAALRGGRVVRVEPGVSVASVETASAAMLQLVDAEQVAPLLLSGQRAAVLGLGNIKDAADPARPVLIERSEWLDREAALAIADPAADLARAPVGPLRPTPMVAGRSAEGALKLARLAGLLPALWWLGVETDGAMVTAAELLEARAEALILARARLPLDGIDDAQIVSFRDRSTGDDHTALLIGAFAGKPPLVRLHSECLTGDVFGSLKCDCGPQLREALRLIAAEGGGVLLYLRQEGRGIGLANKIRAYQLQDRGLDTVDANRRLGFVDDARDYGIAAAMLRPLGIDKVRLLTNNPAKLAGLEQQGISVVERVAHQMPTNPHNADYIATKRDRSGHLV